MYIYMLFYTKIIYNIHSFIRIEFVFSSRTVSSRDHCIWTIIKPHPHKSQLITCFTRKSVSLSVLLLNLFLWPLHTLSLSISPRPLPALFLTLVIFIPVSSCPPPTSPVTKQPILDAHWGTLPQVGNGALHCMAPPASSLIICPITSSSQSALITESTFSHCSQHTFIELFFFSLWEYKLVFQIIQRHMPKVQPADLGESL